MTPWHPLPRQIFEFLEHTPGTVLLHSSRPGGSSVSRLFTDPLHTIEVRDLAELPALFAAIEAAVERGHFAVGYFEFECAPYFEPAVPVRTGQASDPLAHFAFYQRCHTFDHPFGTFSSDPPLSIPAKPAIDSLPLSSPSALTFGLTQPEYADSVNQIHEWIRAGDVYQLNLTFPLRAEFSESPSRLYTRLSHAQPVEYGAFVHIAPGRHILSFSPELFFWIDANRRITTRPMKGTAPRGRTTAEDNSIAEWLAHDPKNRAENVMIVDLIRNDLGRICSFGSVKVESLFDVERYPSLWQMTSCISGDLRPGTRYEEIFRALFPCGSVTGAPKIRAMQLLSQIEKQPRGVYTGAIGYFSREQTIFNVAIRTLEIENGTARGGIGSGIVIDSEPAAEYRECQLKAEFLTRSAEPFSLIETMLWSGNFSLLEFHLDRLSDSASYFEFVCDRETIRTTLLNEAACFSDIQPRKVRLLLHANGEIQLQTETPSVTEQDDALLKIRIASQPTDSADRFLFHKTTRRDLYNRAYAAARAANFADVLFLNSRQEITEGAVHNIFIEKSGRWYTPPLDCGVLPGVYRRHLLATRPGIEEKVLTLEDMKAADSVYICNAVRGLRKITIDFQGTLSF